MALSSLGLVFSQLNIYQIYSPVVAWFASLRLSALWRKQTKLLHCETAIRFRALTESQSMQTIFIGMTGRDEFVPLLTGERVMPLNEIPKYFNPETRHLVDAALEDAWQELNKDGLVEAHPARMKLASTIVALASVGETDPGKLKWFALHAAQSAFRATKAKAPALPS